MKGGVATLLSPQLASTIVGLSTHPTQQLVWTWFNLDGHLLGLANIYESNYVEERTTFWRWMVDELPLPKAP